MSPMHSYRLITSHSGVSDCGKQKLMLLLVSLLFFASCDRSTPQEMDNTDQVQETAVIEDTGLLGCDGMDSAFEALVTFMESELAKNDVPGAAVGIVCDGRLAYTYSWGVTHHQSGDPITASTRFQLASTTKMFTAATALSLVEEGTVSLFEPVSTYVPYTNTSAPYEETMTLHELLSHSAGYPTYFPDGSFASYDLDTFFENNAEQPLWSPPGVLYNYSNLGMSLAGLVLQEATGKKFAELVETRIFNPAGMDGASMHATVVESTGNFAYGHSGSAASPTVTSPTDSYYPTEYYGPMGGAWGSVEDLARWSEVHLQGGKEVLSASAMGELRTPQIATRKFPLQSYGYGLFIDSIYGYDLVHHSGSVGGYLTSWLMVPEADFSVVAVTNCDWYYPTSIAYEALDLFVGISSIDLSPYLTNQEDWPQFEGTYLDPVSLGTIHITVDGSSLVADFVDQGVVAELMGYYQETYYLWYEPTGSWLYLSFWPDEEGKKTQYLVSLYGVATRTD